MEAELVRCQGRPHAIDGDDVASNETGLSQPTATGYWGIAGRFVRYFTPNFIWEVRKGARALGTP